MSQDEIVFDDLRYREPERRRRPDRDRRWACLAYEVPGPADLPVFLDRGTADAIERHALRDTSVELGGILLGKECLDDETGEPFVWVTQSLEAKHYENTQASFTYTHDSWEEISRERDRLHPDLDIVGWYHTHPDFGIFLSSHDQFIHRHFFVQPLQVAYVVDPIRQTRGFFQWRDGLLVQVGGFYLSAERGDRIALSRLVNDLENFPNTESGGGLSPRLEAELIAMLTRPPQPLAATADRIQIAALSGMLGMLAGVVVLCAAFWLYALSTSVREQAASLRELETTVKQSTGAQRLALDTLLAGVPDGRPEKFTARYAQAVRERDEAVAGLQNQKMINDALGARAKELRDGMATLSKHVEKYKKGADESEKNAQEAERLGKRVVALEGENETLSQKARELDAILETTEGRKTASLVRKYERAWWVAVSGLCLSVLLALGLIAVYAGPRPAPEEETKAGPFPREEPPHRIG